MGISSSQNLGFEELSPSKIAIELFRNLQSGDKIAIVTRKLFSKRSQQSLQDVVNALITLRGFVVRIVEPSYQNFCFMMKAQKE